MNKLLTGLVSAALTLALVACVPVPNQETAAPGVAVKKVAFQLQKIEDGDNTCYLYVGNNHRSALSCVKTTKVSNE